MSDAMIRPARGLAALVAGVAMTVGLGACSLDFSDSGARARADSGNPAETRSGASTGGPGATPTTDLAKGDCIKELPHQLDDIDEVILVDCGTAHEAQVIGAYEATGGSWPGRDELEAGARVQCRVVRAGAIRADAPNTDYFLNIFPDEQEWRAGHRTVQCLFPAKKGTLLTRSVLN